MSFRLRRPTHTLTGAQTASEAPLFGRPVQRAVRRHYGTFVDSLFCGLSVVQLAFLRECLEYNEAPFTQVSDVVLELSLRSTTH